MIEVPIELDQSEATKAIADLTRSLDALTATLKVVEKTATTGASKTAKETQKTTKEVGKLTKSFNACTVSAKTMGTVAKVGLAAVTGVAVAATAALYSLAKTYSGLNTEMGKAARNGPEGVETLRNISKFAGEAGINLDQARAGVNKLMESFNPKSAEAVYKALADINAVAGGNSDSLSALTATISEFSNKAGLGGADLLKFSKQSGQSVASLMDSIAKATGKSGKEVERLLKNNKLAVEDLLDGASAMAATGALGGSAISSAASDPMAQIQRLSNTWQEFREGLAVAVFTPEVVEGFSAVVDVLQSAIPGAVAATQKAFKKVGDTFAWIEENSKLVKAGLAAIGTTLLILLLPTIKVAIVSLGAMAVAAAAAIIPMLPFIAVAAAIGLAIGALIYYWDDLVAAFKAGAEWVGKTVDKIWGYVKDLPETFKQLGLDLLQGLLDGLLKGPMIIGKKITEIAQSAIKSFKSVMGIASPSKLFKEFGMDTTEGFTIGLDQGSKEVDSKISHLFEMPSTPKGSASGGVVINFDFSGATDPARFERATRDQIVPVLLETLQNLRLQGAGF